jgi:uncharacterized protein (DUF736 family)
MFTDETMKIIPFLCLSLSYDVHSRFVSEHFQTDRLTNEFGQFRIVGCSDEIGQCWKTFHDKAKTCVAKFRTNPKFQTCMNRQDVKDGHRAFVQSMFKWHKSMGLCLAGNECEDCPAEIQSDAASDDEALYFFKREIDDNEDSDEGNESDQLKNAMRKCFKGVGKWQRQCQKDSVKCEVFARCFGEGQRPNDQRLSRWYTAIKDQRGTSERMQRTFYDALFNCISNEPGADTTF